MKKVRLYVLLLALLALVTSCSEGAKPQEQSEASPPATPVSGEVSATVSERTPAENGPRKWALLIGINKYKYPDRVSPLAGAINDVEDLKSVLIGKFEFPPENILVLKDAQATHAGIIDAIQNHLIANVNKDDLAVFHFSGHGSQMKDVTGKKISGLDETIVPYDSRDPAGQVFDISGAELHGLLLRLAEKTKNITFILDSCHSGTLVREVRGARTRGIPADDRKPPDQLPSYAVATRSLGAGGENSALSYAFIAAATSRESAFEHFAENKERGALTYFLVRKLRSVGASATYRDVMDNVAGNVTANYPAQHPQLEGAEADNFVFGDKYSLSRSFVTASPLNASSVLLGAGDAQGVSRDSIYDVYKPGTKKFSPPEQPIARVQVTQLAPFGAEAKVISGGKIPQFSRAVERERRYGNRKLRIYIDGSETSPPLQSIKSALAALPYIELVNDAATPHIQLRESRGRILTLAADATTLSTPVPTDAQNMTDRLLEQIGGWAKWYSILSIDNPQPDVDIQLTIDSSETRDIFARVGKADAGVLEGERIRVSIKNVSNKDLYVSMLDLSSDGSIAIVYPSVEGASAVLQPGLSHTMMFTAEVPKGRSVVTDVLKVFASTKPIDLKPLTRPAIREIGTELDPLQVLIDDASGSSRTIPKPLSLGGWTTTERVLVVRRRG